MTKNDQTPPKTSPSCTDERSMSLWKLAKAEVLIAATCGASALLNAEVFARRAIDGDIVNGAISAGVTFLNGAVSIAALYYAQRKYPSYSPERMIKSIHTP